MDILEDMHGLARIDARPWETYSKAVWRPVAKDRPKQKVVEHLRVKGFTDLTTWSSCSVPLNGILHLKEDETLEEA